MITAEKATLLNAIATAEHIVSKKTTIPILANIKIVAFAERMEITGTDMDVEITSTCVVATDDALRATVPAATFKEIVSRLPDGREITIEYIEKDAITIKAGRSRFTIHTLPADDFPDLDRAGDYETAIDIDAARLVEAFKGLFSFISTEETRYYLNGIFAHKVGGKLFLVATDGHRLARRAIAWPDDAEAGPFDAGIIIPRRTVEAINKTLAKHKTFTIEASARKIKVTAGQSTITSKLVDGTFPDYQRIIDANKLDKTISALRSDIAGAAGRAAVMNAKSGAMRLEFGQEFLTISVTNPDTGSAAEDLEIDMDCAPFFYGVNGKFLIEAIDEINGETVLMRLGDLEQSMTIQSGDAGTDPDDLILVMPVRLAR